MSLRRWIALAVVLVVAALGAAFAVVFLGGDAPPPPSLSDDEAAATTEPTATPEAASPSSSSWTVSAGGQTFVGYRVREEFAGIGVKDAVGRTPDVSGSVDVEGDTITAATLDAELSTLVSDEARRDNALTERGIETARFPTATFELTEPVELSRSRKAAAGTLTLHGETQPIEVALRSQRIGDSTIELAGSAPIAFADFGIEPPSIAGFVTVEDNGTLEFKIRLRPVA
jgi:polyisoprenoid-binding protein YceI